MPRGNAALGPVAEIVAHPDQRTRPRARQERFDAEFAKAVKGTGIEPRDGWTLHRIRRSTLTRDAEGTSTPMLLARSRHASARSLERYARPSVDAVARHVAERDPAARRRR
ncbi:hypothetical protein [Streptomyces sp. A5-4]|uniref:hypothetical protein n=1 Tax=Streptomyces sp. A5-4 TaxID=3384771 RepID=UPI003DA9E8FA